MIFALSISYAGNRKRTNEGQTLVGFSYGGWDPFDPIIPIGVKIDDDEGINYHCNDARVHLWVCMCACWGRGYIDHRITES